MQKFTGTNVGKIVRLTTSFRNQGGHALPGLVVDNIFPGYVYKMLEQLPEGVILITGTNGKTTTTKAVVEMLSANGKKVITNSTGSNMIRGIASSLIKEAKISGRLPFDVGVFEVDEASARPLVARVKPRWVLALNASRDQLDRFGEVDTIARHIGTAMEAATEGVVTNADDPNLSAIAQGLKNAPVYYFGVTPSLLKHFPSDYDLAAVGGRTHKKLPRPQTAVELIAFEGKTATYRVAGETYKAHLQLSGQHNFQNGAAALTLLHNMMPDVPMASIINQLANVSLAFGRGETYGLKAGAEVELVLVKNPASFRQALASYASPDNSVMIAINDNIADGRDVSWLWDVDFKSLAGRNVRVTSGQRAADIALRLSYDDILVEKIEPNLNEAVEELAQTRGHKVILATYTAMLSLHDMLSSKAGKV